MALRLQPTAPQGLIGSPSPCLRTNGRGCLSNREARTEILYLFIYLGLHLQHMEVPRLGTESLALAAGLRHSPLGPTQHLRPTPHLTAMPKVPSHLNPLSEARDQSHVFMDPSQVHYR